MRLWVIRAEAVLCLLVCAALSPVRAEEGGPKIDLTKGGPTFQSGPNSLTIGARVQFRWTVDDREGIDSDATGTSGFGEEDGTASQFAVQRMRVSFKGGMFRPWLKYEFQFDFANTSGQSDNKIKDAFLDLGPWRHTSLRLGQFKTPFSLQQLTSSGRLQFVDRAITDGKFVPGRDTGLTFSGTCANKKFGWAAGPFNGGGESRAQDDQGLLWVGRLWWDPLAEYALTESAVDGKEEASLHLGLAVHSGEAIRGTATTGVFEDPDDQQALGFEFAWRQKRLFGTAEWFQMSDEQANPVVGPDVDSNGWNAQFGFMVVPQHFELALRRAEVEPDEDISDSNVVETRLAAGWYWQGHNLKIQADAGQIEYDAGFAGLSDLAKRGLPDLGTRLTAGVPLTDKQLRVQFQLAF